MQDKNTLGCHTIMINQTEKVRRTQKNKRERGKSAHTCAGQMTAWNVEASIYNLLPKGKRSVHKDTNKERRQHVIRLNVITSRESAPSWRRLIQNFPIREARVGVRRSHSTASTGLAGLRNGAPEAHSICAHNYKGIFKEHPELSRTTLQRDSILGIAHGRHGPVGDGDHLNGPDSHR